MKRGAWLALLTLGCASPTESIPDEFLPMRDFAIPVGVTIDAALLVTGKSGTYLDLSFGSHATTTQQVEYGNCAASLLAYSGKHAEGSPVWSSRGPDSPGCVPDIAWVRDVPPGGGLRIRLDTLPADAVRDPGTGKDRSVFVVLQVRGETQLRTLRAVPGAPPPGPQ